MLKLSYSKDPPPGFSLEHDLPNNLALLQTPDGETHPLEIIVPALPGDAPFAEHDNLLIAFFDGIPEFATV